MAAGVSLSEIVRNLNETKTELTRFKELAHKPDSDISKEVVDKLMRQLNKLGEDMDTLHGTQGISKATLEKHISQSILDVIDQTLAIVKSIQTDKSIRTKVNLLQVAMFTGLTNSLDKFHNRLQNLKQLKRGERVAGIELDQQGRE